MFNYFWGEITFGVLDLIAPLKYFKWDQKSVEFSVRSDSFLVLFISQFRLLILIICLLYSSWFSGMAHYVRAFWILLKELSNSGKFFSRKSKVLTIPRFFWLFIHLTSLFILRVLSPHSDMISVNFLTAFWVALVLLDVSKINLIFRNFSWVNLWFCKEWNKIALWLSHLHVFEWLSTFAFPNLTKELLKVAVIGAFLESKLAGRTLNFIIFFIRDLPKTR